VLTPELLTAEHQARWLEQHYDEVFASQLRPWTEDESAWPADRSLLALSEWFDLTWVAVCDDLSHLPLGPPVACGPVSLTALSDEFALLSDGSQLFLDVQSGDMVSFSPEELDALEGDDPAAAGITAEALADTRRLYETESLVPLPSPSEQLTLTMMQAFADDARPPAIRNRLLNALDSKKPPRRFLEAVDASGIRKQWTGYFQQALLHAIRETLDRYRVPYVGAAEGDKPGPAGTRPTPPIR
jgi:hypothetical protein